MSALFADVLIGWHSVHSNSGGKRAGQEKRGYPSRDRHANVTQSPCSADRLWMGMELRADQISLAGHWAENSASFGPDGEVVGEDELSSAMGNLRLWLDPFLLVSWVREEARSL